MLTLIDVSGLKAAEDALFHERYLLNSLLVDRARRDLLQGRARPASSAPTDAMAARLGLADPARGGGQDGLRAARRPTSRSRSTARTTTVAARPARRSTTGSSAATDADGGEGWDLVTRLPLRDRDGGIVGIIAIFRDVTEQKRAEEKIQEAVRRRDQFLAMLSHELRNPLGAIVTATALLKGDSPARTAARFLEILDRQSQQMARLLDDLLEVSRVTQNKIELRKRVVDLRAVARDAADACRFQMERAGIRFSDRDRRRARSASTATRRACSRSTSNLLSNAAKYTPRGGRRRARGRGARTRRS